MANWEKTLFWTNEKFVFFFNCSNWEKFVEKIRETNWWNYLMNSLQGYKTLMRRQKGYFKIVTNTQSITSDTFTSSRVFVLAGPREKFTENEFDHLRRYLETGGSILVLLGEGGEKRQFVRFIYLDSYQPSLQNGTKLPFWDHHLNVYPFSCGIFIVC